MSHDWLEVPGMVRAPTVVYRLPGLLRHLHFAFFTITAHRRAGTAIHVYWPYNAGVTTCRFTIE